MKTALIFFLSILAVILVIAGIGFAKNNNQDGQECPQVITQAYNPRSFECRNFSTPCDVPKKWIIGECPVSTQIITENECKKSCNIEYTNTIQTCNENYRNTIHSCNEARKAALERCNELKGEEKRQCVKSATNASKQCKASANQVKRECKENARTQKNACKELCNLYTCCLGDYKNAEHEENCFQASIPECRALGGAVMECIPTKGKKLAPGTQQNYSIINATQHSGWLKDLTDAANASGIPNRTYVPGTYDCDDFADDMEKNLTSLGYNATYTVYWCYDNAGNPTVAHAVTDVHAPDGSLVFIEPQRGTVANLDFDNDGTVEARTHHENNKVLTDDNCEIEVYSDAASAGAAGAPRD